jgi:hypothetical protein
MSAAEKAEKATEKATEVVTDAAADVAAEVAQQAEQMEKFIRSLNKVKVQFGLLGAVIGAGVGATVSFAVAYRRAQTKYSKLADEEISEMRQHYMEKGKALESEAAKRPLDEIVEEQGYSSAEIEDTPPPMVVKPPTPEPEKVDNIEVVDPPDAEVVRNIFTDTEVTHEWDWHAERRSRSPDVPYVIHYDEQHEMDYQIVTVTYYEGDDVLCYDNDEVIDPDKRDEIIGEGNLDRFGHGSNDAAIVYIRNDKLELVFEVVRSPNHYAEEVHGFQHTEYGGNLERMRVRERDEQDD